MPSFTTGHGFVIPYPSREVSRLFSCSCGQYTEAIEWGAREWSIEQAIAHLEQASGSEALQFRSGDGTVHLLEGGSL